MLPNLLFVEAPAAATGNAPDPASILSALAAMAKAPPAAPPAVRPSAIGPPSSAPISADQTRNITARQPAFAPTAPLPSPTAGPSNPLAALAGLLPQSQTTYFHVA